MNKEKRVPPYVVAMKYQRRFEKAVSGAKSKIYELPFKDRKPLEIKLAYMVRDVEQYGFNFFPDHYIGEALVAIENFEV